MSNLAQAIRFAQLCHDGQTRKYNGEPYINHPIRVMDAIALDLNIEADEELLCAAVLHDVVEDTDAEIDDIVPWGYNVQVLVNELTNRYDKESYPDLNRRKRKELEFKRLAGVSDKAKVIKLYDRIDNLRDFFRVPDSYHFETAEEWLMTEPEMRKFGRVYARESWELMMAIWDDPSRAHISTQLATLAARLRDACKP